MEIVAKSKHIRMSPRKLRLVVDSLRSLSLDEAMVALENLNKRAVKPLKLTFKQAIGNAVNNFGLKKEDLIIKEMQVGEGPTLKRWRAVSRGRARRINKRTSHLRVVLEGKEKDPALRAVGPGAKSKELRAKSKNNKKNKIDRKDRKNGTKS